MRSIRASTTKSNRPTVSRQEQRMRLFLNGLLRWTVIGAMLAAIPAAAQTLTGSVAGVVKDQQSAVLPGVTVTLTGINSNSAYGGESSSANALLIDGVDTRDPEGGTAWTFYNYNLVQEIQFQGIGAAAEYGGFTGAVE